MKIPPEVENLSILKMDKKLSASGGFAPQLSPRALPQDDSTIVGSESTLAMVHPLAIPESQSAPVWRITITIISTLGFCLTVKRKVQFSK